MAPAADREGYWGPPTSTLEWCEENYAVSYHIAEFCEWPPRPGSVTPSFPHPADQAPRQGDPPSSMAALC